MACTCMYVLYVHFVCTWCVAPFDDVLSNCLIIDSNVHLIVATEPCCEGYLDDAVTGGWSRLNDVRDDGGDGAFVDNTAPEAVRGLKLVWRLIVAKKLHEQVRE